MRLGVMIGAERGDMARKVKKLLEDIEWAEAAGMDTAWMPQVPNDFDCLTMVALMGTRTTRIELGTAVVPLQAQHPIALARQALSVHAGTGGRLALGVGPSHHWIVRDMLGLPYEKPAAYTRDYLEVLNAALAGPGEVDVENDMFTVHNPTVLGAAVAAAGAGRRARAGDAADRRRARRRHGAVDGRRACDRRAHRPAHQQGRRRRRPPGAADRRGHPGVPVRQLGDRRREGARQPHPGRGRDVAQLPAAAGSRRRPQRRRPVRGR